MAGFFVAGFLVGASAFSAGLASAFDSAAGFDSALAAGLRLSSLTSVTSSFVSAWRWPLRRLEAFLAL